jgi:alpha-glucosidase/alpha-D-xyloside xylohydrolase
MEPIPRRQALKALGAAGAGALIGVTQADAQDVGTPIVVAGTRVEVVIEPVSRETVRISLIPARGARPGTGAAAGRGPGTGTGTGAGGGAGAAMIPLDGSLVKPSWSKPAARITTVSARGERVRAGDLTVVVSSGASEAGAANAVTIRIDAADGRTVQTLRVDASSGAVTFPLGDGPVLGFGQGGPQFDRRGIVDRMRSGAGAYRLRTHGGRVPVPWLIGTSGWAMFIHQPFGSFDLTGPDGRFTPAIQGAPEKPPAPGTPGASAASAAPAALPLDIFVVASREPAAVMAEYARLTGFPELPPLWTLGYQQSHRTLASREEVVGIAKTFREKKLPCDALIYLGTGFTNSGWNTGNGTFSFNRTIFTDPKGVIDELHAHHFRVVLHAVILARVLRGGVNDGCELSRYDEEEAGCYWNTHRKPYALGVDGWWPDEGDALRISSRLARNRMYWEGPQLDRPDERPYALHRNGYAGMQRYASFLWSGDPFSTWETLRNHVPNAINTGLTGIPLWGTDVGGFVPTPEFTGELYVRWFQFGAFCTLFRSHGRTWKLRLPWGWNTGSYEPDELISTYEGAAGNPDASELHNAAVEPICRQYLELRYRLLPYLYSAVYEGHRTGLPVMRSLWLHHPGDRAAVARGDQYLWGRDMLVAPVTEKGVTSRKVYLPRLADGRGAGNGKWFDFWTNETFDSGQEIDRQIDLATMPLYVRAGAIIPMGPVKQYTDERVDGPLTVTVYPGADGAFLMYEDDGKSFAHRKGAWTGIEFTWHDASRRLTIRLAKGSRLLPPARRAMELRLASAAPATTAAREITFEGRELVVTF